MKRKGSITGGGTIIAAAPGSAKQSKDHYENS
jgi:hypothetical protein